MDRDQSHDEGKREIGDRVRDILLCDAAIAIPGEKQQDEWQHDDGRFTLSQQGEEK